MAFSGYLTNQEITDLTAAAVAGGLLDVPRAVLLTGLPSAFAAGMAHADNPLDQFTLDLVRVNGVERMAGGEVPVLILLGNAEARLRLAGRAEAGTFQRALSRVGNLAVGVPPLPDPSSPPEVAADTSPVTTPYHCGD